MFTRRDFLGLLSATSALSLLPSCQTPSPNSSSLHPTQSTTPRPDRFATLARHNPHITSVAQDAVLSVGNGNFAFNVDCTGLQSMPSTYNLIPLATLSHWGWHSRPLPAGLNPADFQLKNYDFHGRQVPYATNSTGQTDLYNYLRENPHRLNLARIGLLLDGQEISPTQIFAIDQTLKLASGIITNRFLLGSSLADGVAVYVTTAAHTEVDAIAVQIRSSLLASGRLTLRIAFPYGSTASSSDGADWTQPSAHQTSTLEKSPGTQVTLSRIIDSLQYAVNIDLSQSKIGLKQIQSHTYEIAAQTDLLQTTIVFDSNPNQAPRLPNFSETRNASEKHWHTFWSTGAAIDLSDCTDPRAPELERRIILSQYQTALHCAGPLPSQETGLLCNSWYGKFHLEMHWWHSAHFSFWNRQPLFERSLPYYTTILESARARAAEQGFKGARWPKMTSPDGQDAPSPIGPLLIWQQPHPLYYAELCYRDKPTAATLQKWRDIVLATADFMASYAALDPARGNVGGGGQYVLGPALRTVPENNSDSDLNPTWELTAWRWGLALAQTWLERLGQPRNPQWDAILQKLAPAPTKDNLYLAHEGQDSFTPSWAYEHPGMLGALGFLPGPAINPAIMAATAREVRQVWDFSRVWGWDYPLAAMCATRTNQPDLALDFLTMDAPTNRYLPNGCNFQRDNVPAYYPGNGGLLAAIALMVAGWDSGPTKPNTPLPGFPKNGKWNIRAEGFRSFL